MRLYRIASNRHPVWDGTGAALLGGRWNSPGNPVIYAAMTYAGAMLELLAHTNTGKVPPSHRCVIAEVPDNLPVTQFGIDALPKGWDLQDSMVAQQIGDDWLMSRQTAVLIIPSVVTRIEFNALVNPAHPDATKIRISEPLPIHWDKRLFTRD